MNNKIYPLVIRKFFPPSNHIILNRNYTLDLINKIKDKEHLNKQINNISTLCHIWIRKNF
jgi:hypothetical protein